MVGIASFALAGTFWNGRSCALKRDPDGRRVTLWAINNNYSGSLLQRVIQCISKVMFGCSFHSVEILSFRVVNVGTKAFFVRGVY